MTIDSHSHPEEPEPGNEAVLALGDDLGLVQPDVAERAVAAPVEPYRDFTSAIREMKLPVVLAVLAVPVLAVLVLFFLETGYFFTQNLFADFAAPEAFNQLMEVNRQIDKAREGPLDPAAWENKSKPLRETIATVQKKVKGGRVGSPRKEVSKMGTYLKWMIENAAKNPPTGAEDEFLRNKKLFEASRKKAAKMLGLSEK